MNYTFGKYIIKLLKEHECVILPEIGGLILKNIPSHISNNKIYPASKIIRFNKNILTEDDLLVSELIKIDKLSYLDAKLQISKFVSTIKFDLAQKGFFDIENIGRFSLSENESIKFIANSDIDNLDKDNFGFKNINVFTVQRVIIKDNYSEIRTKKTVKISKRKTAKTIVRKLNKPAMVGLVATIVLMFGISSLIMTNTTVDKLKVENANVLNFLVPKQTELKKHYGEIISFDSFVQEEGKKKKKKKKKKKTASDNKNVIIIDDINEEETESESFVIKKEEVKKENSELDNYTKDFRKEEKNTEEEKIFTHPIINNVLTVHNKDNPIGYYIVIGAYGSLSNANKAKYTCSIDNTCRVFKTKTGMYRVAIYTTSDPESAIDILTDFKKNNNSYWLMLNE